MGGDEVQKYVMLCCIVMFDIIHNYLEFQSVIL